MNTAPLHVSPTHLGVGGHRPGGALRPVLERGAHYTEPRPIRGPREAGPGQRRRSGGAVLLEVRCCCGSCGAAVHRVVFSVLYCSCAAPSSIVSGAGIAKELLFLGLPPDVRPHHGGQGAAAVGAAGACAELQEASGEAKFKLNLS